MKLFKKLGVAMILVVPHFTMAEEASDDQSQEEQDDSYYFDRSYDRISLEIIEKDTADITAYRIGGTYRFENRLGSPLPIFSDAFYEDADNVTRAEVSIGWIFDERKHTWKRRGRDAVVSTSSYVKGGLVFTDIDTPLGTASSDSFNLEVGSRQFIKENFETHISVGLLMPDEGDDVFTSVLSASYYINDDVSVDFGIKSVGLGESYRSNDVFLGVSYRIY